MADGRITRESSSYRQGLVLGLTMAEILLLLVFCLLIATAAVFARTQAAQGDLQRRLVAANDALARAEQLASLVQKSPQLREALEQRAGADPAEIDKFWRKLVDSTAVVEALERQGVSLEELRRDGAYVAEATALRAAGVDAADAVRDARLVAKIDGAMHSSARVSDERVLAMLQAGLSSTSSAAGHQWPPIISLSEAKGYYFQSGKAELSPSFRAALHTSVVPRLLATAGQYHTDMIEVVGHTDEQPVGSRDSNLDQALVRALTTPSSIETLRPADNAGLGLARAVAVVSELKEDVRLAHFKFLPLSGGQLIRTDESLTNGSSRGSIKERRRIEIRMWRSTTAEADH